MVNMQTKPIIDGAYTAAAESVIGLENLLYLLGVDRYSDPIRHYAFTNKHFKFIR